MKSRIATTLLLVVSLVSSAQSIKVTDLAIDAEGKVSFRYSISQKHSERESYQLQIFSSADEFNSPIPVKLTPVAAGSLNRVSFDGPELIGDHLKLITFSL